MPRNDLPFNDLKRFSPPLPEMCPKCHNKMGNLPSTWDGPIYRDGIRNCLVFSCTLCGHEEKLPCLDGSKQ